MMNILDLESLAEWMKLELMTPPQHRLAQITCFQSTPLKIPQRSSCPQDTADSTQKSIGVPSCYPALEQVGDLDSSREITREDFSELEDWLEDMDQNSEQKHDDDQLTSEKYLETSPNARSIDTQPTSSINIHPRSSFSIHQTESMGTHLISMIDTHGWTSCQVT